MKNLLYYVTDNGLGHTTRSIAIIRELLRNDFSVTIRNSKSDLFFRESLPKCKIIGGITDVGQKLGSDGISIDEINSKKSIESWIDKINENSIKEIDNIKKLDPDLIISDVSVLPLQISKKLKITSIIISNFSWYDVLYFLDDNRKNLLRTYYNFADFCIQLPFSTKMNHFSNKKKVGHISRHPTKTRDQIRENLGIHPDEFLILLSVENSNLTVKYPTQKKFKIMSTSKINQISSSINLKNYVEGQNLVNAADFVICKCGYGMITECLTSGTPFSYIYSKIHIEQKAISEQLIKLGYNNGIEIDDLKNNSIDVDIIMQNFSMKKEPRDNKTVVNYIQELLVK